MRIKISGLVLLMCSLNVLAQQNLEPSSAELRARDEALGVESVTAFRSSLTDQIPPLRQSMTVATLTNASSIAVEAAVSKILYSYEGAFDQPYTTIIFEVRHVIKGAVAGASLTVKQAGGPTKDGDHLNIVSDAHYFNLEEVEVLFLEANGSDLMIQRRFKVFNGALYSADGLPLIDVGNGELAFGVARSNAETFTTINIGAHTLYKNFSSPDLSRNDSGSDDDMASQSRLAEEPIKLDAFFAMVPQLD